MKTNYENSISRCDETTYPENLLISKILIQTNKP